MDLVKKGKLTDVLDIAHIPTKMSCHAYGKPLLPKVIQFSKPVKKYHTTDRDIHTTGPVFHTGYSVSHFSYRDAHTIGSVFNTKYLVSLFPN